MPKKSESHRQPGIRPARTDDIPAVLRIARLGLASERYFSHYFDELHNPLSRFFIAEDPPGGDAVAFLIFWRIEDTIEIHDIVVAPEYRGRGIGRALMKLPFEEAKRANATRIFLEVRESNRRARRFYEFLGFTMTARRSGYYRNPSEDALILVWESRPPK